MSQPLPRFYRAQQAILDSQFIGTIIDTTDNTHVETVARATLPGDRRRLRGIPVAGGACGTSPGTDPLQAAIHNESHRARTR